MDHYWNSILQTGQRAKYGKQEKLLQYNILIYLWLKKEDIRNALRRIRKKGDVDIARNADVDDIIPQLVDRLDEDSDDDDICDNDPNETEKRNLVG